MPGDKVQKLSGIANINFGGHWVEKFSTFVPTVSIKTCPEEDGGLIGPMKPKPHLESVKSGRQFARAWKKIVIY